MKQFSKELGKVSITPKGAWDSNMSNDRLDIVYDKRNNQAYIAKQDVPVGVDIDNREYWQPLNVSGYADNNFINLCRVNSNGNLIAYDDLQEAISSVEYIGRKPGAVLSFYNINKDRKDNNYQFELWQFNSADITNWEDIHKWRNIYYNFNVFCGWYVGEAALINHVPIPNVGQYAFVGAEYDRAYLYQCRAKGVWTNTNTRYAEYISITLSGNITIGDNGNWFVDGEDTGIPSTPQVEDTLEDIQDLLREHEFQFKDQQSQIDTLGHRATRIEDTNEQILETLDGIAISGGASTAEAVVYNNNDSPLKAINVKQALDELANSKKYLTQEQYDDLVRIGEVKEDVEYNILEEE